LDEELFIGKRVMSEFKGDNTDQSSALSNKKLFTIEASRSFFDNNSEQDLSTDD